MSCLKETVQHEWSYILLSIRGGDRGSALFFKPGLTNADTVERLICSSWMTVPWLVMHFYIETKPAVIKSRHFVTPHCMLTERALSVWVIQSSGIWWRVGCYITCYNFWKVKHLHIHKCRSFQCRWRRCASKVIGFFCGETISNTNGQRSLKAYLSDECTSWYRFDISLLYWYFILLLHKSCQT